MYKVIATRGEIVNEYGIGSLVGDLICILGPTATLVLLKCYPQLYTILQIVRDYLESIDWDKQPPLPTLPPEIIQKAVAVAQQQANQRPQKRIKGVCSAPQLSSKL